MANNLGGAAKKFTARLDKIIEAEAKTSFLNMNSDLVGELNGNGEVEIAKIAMDGLGDYDRAVGFPAGSVTLDWETVKLNYERAREFEVDVMDDEERELVVSANLMAEFARAKVVPEVDAIRFSKLTEKAGVKKAETFADADAALDAVLLAEEALQDAGAQLSTCKLCLTSHMKTLLRKAQPWRIGQGEAPNGNFDTFDEMQLIVVPGNRFFTAIDLLDGKTTGEEAGGYKQAAAGVPINFMAIHPSAAAVLNKHEKLRYFSPDVNQDKEAHKWQYRLFHDVFVYENKAGLIYSSYKA